jgi:hypothetical protein
MTELRCPECGMEGTSLGDVRLHVMLEHDTVDDASPSDASRRDQVEERSTGRALGETIVLGLGTVTILTLCLYLLAVGIDLSLDWI